MTAPLLRSRPFQAACGILADLALGEPPLPTHPVSAFARAMRPVERRLYADRRSSGVAHSLTGVALGAAAGRLVGSTAVATYVAVAAHGLADAAGSVATALEAGDLDEARRRLPALVGRDTAGLGEADIARAVVESVAENSVDAVVAPALYGALAGSAGAWAYRAVNTMDSTVGYRNERYGRYGWAAARLDDAANWVPARLTAALVIAVRPGRAGEIVRAVRRDAPNHPSPNAGVAEAAFAAALGLELGGTSTYGGRVEHRPALGRGRLAAPADIPAAVTLLREVTLALAGALALVGVADASRRSSAMI